MTDPDPTIPAEDIFLEDMLNQRAVYWPTLGINDEGQREYDEPVEIVCRWEMIAESFLDRGTGNMAQSRSKVFSDRDLTELGVLWLPPDSGVGLDEGQALFQLTNEDEPFSNAGAFEIRRFDKMPNFDGDEFVRIAYL